MREGSSRKLSTSKPSNELRSLAKSLFRKIFPLSPCGSIFYPDPTEYDDDKLFRMKILPNTKEKNASHISRRILVPQLGQFPARTSERPPTIGAGPRLFRARHNLYWLAQRSTI
jgi:hypothetical protein